MASNCSSELAARSAGEALELNLKPAGLFNADGETMGLGISEPRPDLEKAISRSRTISERLSKGIAYLFKKNNIEHIEGYAHFDSGNKLMVESKDGSKQVSAKHVIVATGARARVFAGMHIDNESYSPTDRL